jgi:hypothetical protein
MIVPEPYTRPATRRVTSKRRYARCGWAASTGVQPRDPGTDPDASQNRRHGLVLRNHRRLVIFRDGAAFAMTQTFSSLFFECCHVVE